jgi:hypothetical protein
MTKPPISITRHRPRERAGSTLVVILGLMGVLIGLILAVTYRVRNAIVNGGNFQRGVEAFVMLDAAKLVIQGRSDDHSLPGPATTAGDQVDLTTAVDGNAKPQADAIGWVHLKPTSATTFEVVAAGGASGRGGVKSGGTIDAAIDPVQNAYDVRYHYRIVYNPAAVAPAPRFQVVVLKVQDNAAYPW